VFVSVFLRHKPKSKKALKVFFMALCLCIIFFRSNVFAKEQETNMLVSDPWLYVIVKFIGGVYWNVHPLYFWNDEGNLVKVSKVSKGDYIFVPYRELKEIKRLGISPKYERLVSIYENKPSKLENSCYFLDPSMLPFIALGVMRSLSAIDPSHYPYYQRRLAEFQTRLDSVVRVGRQLLWNVEIFDLTGFSGCWLRAVSGRSKQIFKAKHEIDGVTPEEFDEIISQIKSNKGVVVYSSNLPKNLLPTLEGVPLKVKFAYPTKEEDFFVYLYEFNLSIWNAYRSANF
jgi:ABC-type Zn uptake system ZnuABC Zn-binding protein ZnuA